jgi:trimethylamine--corrinoid protein Co-methyltransferase
MIPTLSAEQIEKIHNTTLYVLEEKGIQVTHPDMQRIAQKHGAEIENDRIKIPRRLLDELLAAVPANFTVGDIAGRCSNVGDGSRHCHAIVTDPWIIDCPSGTPRRPIMDDVIRNTVLGQKLDKVVAMSCMDFPVADFSDKHSNLRALNQHLLHHNKHNFIYAAGEDSLLRWRKLIELYNSNSNCEASLFSMAVAVISPLIISDFNIDIILAACQYDVPIIPTICPMAGTTSPYSLYGTLLQGNIENIGLAALVQMVKPDQPVFYMLGPSVTDLSNGNSLYYTIDKVCWKSAAIELAKSYRIPVVSESGGTMSSHFDQQNGMEGILFMLASVISGADFVTGFGSCYNAVGMAPEMTVIHDAWFDAVQFLQRKINFAQADMALDSIMKIGEEQHFLADDLTLENMHGQEFFKNDLFDFSGAKGKSVPMIDRAHDKVMELTAKKPVVLPDKLAEQIQRFFRDEYCI